MVVGVVAVQQPHVALEVRHGQFLWPASLANAAGAGFGGGVHENVRIGPPREAFVQPDERGCVHVIEQALCVLCPDKDE